MIPQSIIKDMVNLLTIYFTQGWLKTYGYNFVINLNSHLWSDQTTYCISVYYNK